MAKEILVSFDGPGESCDIDPVRIERLVARVLEGERTAWTRIGVVFTGHDRVHALNRDFLGHDHETDVLSFVIDRAEDGLEGEVYVDVETARERHEEFNTSFQDEIERYLVHGVLHLAGYEDDAPEKKRVMHELESRYLSAGG